MSIENKIKKEIAQKWNNEFPDLSQFAQNKLYKIIGPLIGGIEIFNQPRSEDYRPYIAWYPLWNIGIANCFKEPIILQEIRNKKGMLYDIPYRKNDIYFTELVMEIKRQMYFSFSGDIQLQELIKLIDSQFSHSLVKFSPIGQAILLEGKLLSALYVNHVKSIEQFMADINKISKSWQNSENFDLKNGKIEEWLQKLKNTINNRQDFLLQIESNKQDKKMSKLAYSELIL
ncbi:MAG: hypothetical protein WAT92_13190 [Saprospiraceae bacterium]